MNKIENAITKYKATDKNDERMVTSLYGHIMRLEKVVAKCSTAFGCPEMPEQERLKRSALSQFYIGLIDSYLGMRACLKEIITSTAETTPDASISAQFAILRSDLAVGGSLDAIQDDFILETAHEGIARSSKRIAEIEEELATEKARRDAYVGIVSEKAGKEVA